MISLSMKPFDPQLARNTAFFSNYVPEQILKALTDPLAKRGIPFKISDKTWKVSYTLTRKDDNQQQKEESKEKDQ